MREKYESLSLATLRELAKARGLRRISALHKEELINRMLEEDAKDAAASQNAAASQKASVSSETVQEKPAAEPTSAVSEEPVSSTSKPDRPLAGRKEAESNMESNMESDNTEHSMEAESRYPAEDGGAKAKPADTVAEERKIYTTNSNRQQRTYAAGSRPAEGDPSRRRNTTYTAGQSYNTRTNPGDRQPRQGRSNTYTTGQTRSFGPNTAGGERGSRSNYNSDSARGERPQRTSYNQDPERQPRTSYNQDSERQPRTSYNQDPERQSHSSYVQAADRVRMPEPARAEAENYSPALPTQERSDAKTYEEAQAALREELRNDARNGIQSMDEELNTVKEDLATIDSGLMARGILEIMQDGFGFIRSANYMPGDNDVYVSPSQIRRFNLKTGDIVCGNTRVKTEREKFSALLYVTSINGYHPSEAQRRPNFEELTPVFPRERISLEHPDCSLAMRVVDLVSPIGKGQRGMIVSQPKAGKTTLLKEVAKSVLTNNPEMHLIILLIDERPEEVTDMKEAIRGDNVEIIYSTFDETPEHHKRVSEMVIERAKRLVEHKKDVMILLDSITRLARAYNLTVQPSGRTLSGGLDPAALHMPKRFFGAARNMREGGSLTILATALVDTGSKMDDVVFEEFKGTGNMELVLDRKLSEKRIFPAIDIAKSGTRREDLLLSKEEQAAVDNMRRALNGLRADEAVENILNIFAHTKTNSDVVTQIRRNRIL